MLLADVGSQASGTLAAPGGRRILPGLPHHGFPTSPDTHFRPPDAFTQRFKLSCDQAYTRNISILTLFGNGKNPHLKVRDFPRDLFF